MTAIIIDGKSAAARIRQRIAVETAAFQRKTSVTPHLAAVLVGDDPASALYVRNKQKACAQAGIASTLHRFGSDVGPAELADLIRQLNDDPSVHGILVQLPLPRQISTGQMLDAISPQKDVDCFHPENIGLLVQGRPRFLPCTPHGIQHLLIESETKISGSHVVILGRSDIVGKPLALLLMQKSQHGNATVTVCHSHTERLAEITRSADILVAAIGSPRFVTADMVSRGATVIDVGTNLTSDGRFVGDVDFNGVRDVARALTPVPGGVGPMTTTMLLENTLSAARLATK